MRVTLTCIIEGCDADVVVEETGRYIPASSWSPTEYPEYEIVACQCAHEDDMYRSQNFWRYVDHVFAEEAQGVWEDAEHAKYDARKDQED